MTDLPLRVGGIVLCGGRSSRMGQPKALLPVGDEVMLQRVVRQLSSVVHPIVVVAAADQFLPDLNIEDCEIRIVRDPVEYRGPLAGLAVGLAAVATEVDAVYVSACDAPLLCPDFVRAMIAALGSAEIAVPHDGQFHHPLAAVYRTGIRPRIEALLATDQLRPVFLYACCTTHNVSTETLRTADPNLESLCNTNTPEEYAWALDKLGLGNTPPPRLPPYTHIPGVTPHPINNPAGHAYKTDRAVRLVTATTLIALLREPECQRGFTLFHHGYYWEAHEEWEALWLSLGRTGPLADFIKGLIKLAAAGVKVYQHQLPGITRHAARARELFTTVLTEVAPTEPQVATTLTAMIHYATQLHDNPPDGPIDRTGRPQPILRPLPTEMTY
ncbi:MAG: DUF309 domain-containing protein [Planctomycetota bacterium]|nr:MAG: DUF309 domain-containing protein [Planctomycetota bacterium]